MKIRYISLRYSALFVLLVCFGSLSAQREDKSFDNFQVAWQLITNFYVDSVNKEELSRIAIEAILNKLDPHSILIPAEEVAAMNEPLDGNFEGVGIEFAIVEDTLTVLSAVSGGPSEKAGIAAGDRIVAVDGKSIAAVGLKNSEVQKLLRGKKGSEVVLSVYRKGQPGMRNVSVIRDKIPINSVEAAYMAGEETGYIKINRFAANTHKEFCDAVKKLKSEGMDNLILDLRGNGGGYLKAALDIVDEFLGNNRLILYTEGKSVSKKNYYSTRNGLWQKGNLILLLDEGSASASEIVAGAIQDWDRGIVVGRRSYGKGLVQRPFTLPDGSEIRLTIANYYTPSGRSIQKPYSNGIKEYRSEINERYSSGELLTKDSIHVNDAAYYETLLMKRAVYGGGGIVPDVFVPIDTTKYSEYYNKLLSSGAIRQYAVQYWDSNRYKLEASYPDFKAFRDKFEVDQAMIDELEREAAIMGIGADPEGLEISGELIRAMLKAQIARNIWGLNAYYEIINPTMSVYNKALELMGVRNLFSAIDKY